MTVAITYRCRHCGSLYHMQNAKENTRLQCVICGRDLPEPIKTIRKGTT